MTVGESLPVNSSSLEIRSPMSTRGRSTSEVMSPCLDTSGSYFSRYMRTVAPTDPDRRARQQHSTQGNFPVDTKEERRGELGRIRE